MPSGTFTVDEAREYLIKYCALMGLDVYLRDGKKTVAFYLSLWVPVLYQVCCVWSFYILRHDTVTILKCVSLWGGAAQCCIKATLAYVHRKDLREAFDFTKSMHQKYEDDPEIMDIFLKSHKTYCFLQRILFFLLRTNFIMLSSYPLIFFIIYGMRTFIVICIIPGLNPDPEAGFPDYEIQTAAHVGAVFVGTSELIALDGMFVYFVMNGAALGETLSVHVRRMATLLAKGSLNEKATTDCIRFLSILHQEYISYVNRLERMYSMMLIMLFISFGFSGSIGLYTAQVSNWYAVYSIVISAVFQLFCCCGLGSIIKHKNSQILDEFYHANWTEMSAKNRRMLLFMMHRARTQKCMTVGNIRELDLETGMDIYKILYSYSILLQDAVKV